ncbi:MAG: hypothetical protein L0207_01825 [Chlamydiae bacterium]|nr:hypothetical protein [Chlamydiota bacterium]
MTTDGLGATGQVGDSFFLSEILPIFNDEANNDPKKTEKIGEVYKAAFQLLYQSLSSIVSLILKLITHWRPITITLASVSCFFLFVMSILTRSYVCAPLLAFITFALMTVPSCITQRDKLDKDFKNTCEKLTKTETNLENTSNELKNTSNEFTNIANQFLSIHGEFLNDAGVYKEGAKGLVDAAKIFNELARKMNEEHLKELKDQIIEHKTELKNLKTQNETYKGLNKEYDEKIKRQEKIIEDLEQKIQKLQKVSDELEKRADKLSTTAEKEREKDRELHRSLSMENTSQFKQSISDLKKYLDEKLEEKNSPKKPLPSTAADVNTNPRYVDFEDPNS